MAIILGRVNACYSKQPSLMFAQPLKKKSLMATFTVQAAITTKKLLGFSAQ
jgi:hypothetical protein